MRLILWETQKLIQNEFIMTYGFLYKNLHGHCLTFSTQSHFLCLSREKYCLFSSGSSTGSIINILQKIFFSKHLQSNGILSPASRNRSQNTECLPTHLRSNYCLLVKLPHRLTSTLPSPMCRTTAC